MEQKPRLPASFDEKTFQANFQGMEDLACQTVQSFLSNLPSLVSSIENAIKSKNSADLELFAHTLKGAVSNFYAEPSRFLAWKLEQLGHGPMDSLADSIFNELQGELVRLTEDLKKYLNSKESK